MVKARDVTTITADRTIERASQIMAEKKIGCMPVVEDETVVVGIVTETDMLRSFQEMLGLPSPGVRVTVRMPDRQGEFARLIAVLAEHHWGVMGVGTFPSRRHPGFYDAVLKIPDATIEQVRDTLSAIPDQEVVDVRTAV
jgi:acetoin utilization protein AcuB